MTIAVYRWAAAATLALLLLTPLCAADAIRGYTVILEGDPVARQVADGRRGAKPEAQKVKALGEELSAKQERYIRRFEQDGVRVLGSTQNVLNAVFVRATRAQAEQIRMQAGVRSVSVARRIKPFINAANDIIRAPAARAALGGDSRAGEGIRIGVIDTGIDITHPAFQDSSLTPPPGFPKSLPENRKFTNGKVIAARSYVNLLSDADPVFSRPDDTTPRDRIGHGTAVAMIAAGEPVDSDVGRLVGVAPKAYLGNYRIFGSPGINDFSNDMAIIAALDDAAVDGMDVLTVSFGAIAQFPWDLCRTDSEALCDPLAEAAENTMEGFGVVIVAAAGNGGALGEQDFPTLNSISTPATALDVIAVGATVNSRQLLESVSYSGRTIDALSGVGPRPTAPFSSPALAAATQGDPLGCSPFPDFSFQGRIAVIDRGGCPPEFKVEFADQAGAVGVVMINTEDRPFPEVILGLETTDIPTFTIGYSDGQQLLNALQGGDVTVTLDPAHHSMSTASDQLAPFSSRGPSVGGGIKPEIVAPGTFIYSAGQSFDPNGDAYTKTGFLSLDGTSFAAPFVAGAAALVWQNNPTLTNFQVRSAVINTANSAAVFGPEGLERVTAVGAGLVDVRAAIEPSAVVDPATLGFGQLNGAALPFSTSLLVANVTDRMRIYTADVFVRGSTASASVDVNGAQTTQFTLRAGEETELTVNLRGAVPQPGRYEGYIRISNSVDNQILNVPYQFFVGDGVPHNSFAIAGTGVVGTINEPHPELLILKVVDQFGALVPDLPVTFSVVDGGGAIVQADPATDAFGVAAADTDMGPDPGFQDYQAKAGNLTVPFLNEARVKPFISGIVNGAGFAAGRAVAPGSIVSVFGDALSELTGSAMSLPLPIALKHVSMSFDFPETGVSVPAHFFFSSDGQLNVQVPWEFQGLNFALVKTRIEDSVSEPVTLNLADTAPGIFEFDWFGDLLAVATHADGSVITSDSPAVPGETIVVYGTGWGPVDEEQQSGEAAAASPLARTLATPAASVGGRAAGVSFSGLTPGYVGLYQANITLAGDTPSGAQTLAFAVNGVASKQTKLWVR